MKPETEAKLELAKEYCDENDKSTGFMIQYMQDVVGVDHDCVIKYLTTKEGFKPISNNQAKRIRKSGNYH